MPTSNEHLTIEETLLALDKVRARIPDWEISIVVVDDYSPDKTKDNVRKIAVIRPYIHLLQKEREGVSTA